MMVFIASSKALAVEGGPVANALRFSAYVASQAALYAWTRRVSSEFADQCIPFTTINMPLVRTPMIAPDKIHKNVLTRSPEGAAEMGAQACIFKPVRVATRLGITVQVMHPPATPRRNRTS